MKKKHNGIKVVERWKNDKGHHYKNPCVHFSEQIFKNERDYLIMGSDQQIDSMRINDQISILLIYIK